MLVVGLGGNNGSALWALHALRKLDIPQPVFGSVFMQADVPIGNMQRQSVDELLICRNIPSRLEQFQVIAGWDACKNLSLREALIRNRVVPSATLAQLEKQESLQDVLSHPIPIGIVDSDCIGLGDEDIVDTVHEDDKVDIQLLVKDIDTFAEKHRLDFVVVVYSGSTETTAQYAQSTPSQIYALATARAKVQTCFINAAAQDTLVPRVKKEFEAAGRLFLGSDLATGETRLKSALLGTFLGQGMPCAAVVCQNHLGNRDGENLADEYTNASKITSKSSLARKLRAFAPTLYAEEKSTPPMEHICSIHYVQAVGDNKRAMDEFLFQLPFGHQLDMFVNSICPDTALALGVLTDLALLGWILHFTTWVSPFSESETQRFSIADANLIASSLLKNPHTADARVSFHENRDFLTEFLIRLTSHKSETRRLKNYFLSKAKQAGGKER